mmetsp:Transcript_6656/g.16967  ORF Transcript_6656/g.16967 Transcript_6656/m.16967 type:complete len:404 (+) Transcript_6656:429-1640(+)
MDHVGPRDRGLRVHGHVACRGCNPKRPDPACLPRAAVPACRPPAQVLPGALRHGEGLHGRCAGHVLGVHRPPRAADPLVPDLRGSDLPPCPQDVVGQRVWRLRRRLLPDRLQHCAQIDPPLLPHPRGRGLLGHVHGADHRSLPRDIPYLWSRLGHGLARLHEPHFGRHRGPRHRGEDGRPRGAAEGEEEAGPREHGEVDGDLAEGGYGRQRRHLVRGARAQLHGHAGRAADAHLVGHRPERSRHSLRLDGCGWIRQPELRGVQRMPAEVPGSRPAGVPHVRSPAGERNCARACEPGVAHRGDPRGIDARRPSPSPCGAQSAVRRRAHDVLASQLAVQALGAEPRAENRAQVDSRPDAHDDLGPQRRRWEELRRRRAHADGCRAHAQVRVEAARARAGVQASGW